MNDIDAPEIEVGFCQCGCGQKTKIARQTNKKLGYVKGVPIRFVMGHRSVDRNRTCSVEGCDREYFGRNMCSKHYQRWKKGLLISRSVKDPNEFVDCDDYWEIYLYDINCNHIASAKIDPGDVEKCKQYKWCLSNRGYVYSGADSSRIYLHKFVMDVTDPSIQVDHKYGVKLDHRKSQLRECMPAQNTQNQKLHNDNTSGERNVCWHSLTGKWKVEIVAFGKRYYFGLHENYEVACQVAKAERKRLHGEFIRVEDEVLEVV